MGSATTQLQQLQAHIMRGSLPGSPFLAPSPLLQHSPSINPHQALFPICSSQPLAILPTKPEVRIVEILLICEFEFN